MRLLLLTILLIATECSAQVPVFRPSRPSTAVVVSPKTSTQDATPAAGGITITQDNRGEVIKSTGTKETEYTVVICGAEWCGPCRNYKKTSEYRRILIRHTVELADIDKYPAWKPYALRVPMIWIIRTKDRARLRSYQGTPTLKQIDDMIEDIRNPKPKVNNGVTMSHRELVDLHNRLHGGGMWSWSGDLRTHIETVHGVATR